MSTVPAVHSIIVNRMKELNWTSYRLAKEVTGKMTAQTVYGYTAMPPRNRLNDVFVGHILDALGLEIRPKNEQGPGTRLKGYRNQTKPE